MLPFAIAAAFGSIIPLPIAPALHPAELGLALLYGLLTALAFALWPLGRAHDIPVSALFRDAVAPERRWPRKRYVIASALVVAVLAVLAVMLSYDRKIAAIFVGAAAAVFVTLELVALLVMAVARRLPHARATSLRLAIANMHRPGTLTPAIVLSLGLGLALLVTVIEIDGNLRRQFEGALPDKAPSFYFVDIQSADAERFDAFVQRNAPQARRWSACRCCAAASCRRTASRPTISSRSPTRPGCCKATAASRLRPRCRAARRVVEGEWWGADYRGPPLVSFEKKIADGLGLKVGDPIVVNVLGRSIEARIANLRAVHWENLGINFVLVFSPSAFAGAPHTDIATLDLSGRRHAEQETALLKAVSEAFPSITAVRVKDAIEAVGDIVRNLVLGGARRKPGGAGRRDAGARRRACRRPQLSGVRRRRAQDARRHARRADRRLRAGISAARRARPRCSASPPARSQPGSSSRG